MHFKHKENYNRAKKTDPRPYLIRSAAIEEFKKAILQSRVCNNYIVLEKIILLLKIAEPRINKEKAAG